MIQQLSINPTPRIGYNIQAAIAYRNFIGKQIGGYRLLSAYPETLYKQIDFKTSRIITAHTSAYGEYELFDAYDYASEILFRCGKDEKDRNVTKEEWKKFSRECRRIDTKIYHTQYKY